jgi:hypothetical protein
LGNCSRHMLEFLTLLCSVVQVSVSYFWLAKS